MIQKIQKLKAKKGFTLVELIVVIAIIGVLAAILIPTMLNFVTQANVASANTTAGSIQDRIDEWLTKLDTKGTGMKLATDNIDLITASITTASNTTTWTVTGPAGATGATGNWTKAPAASTGYTVPTPGYACSSTGPALAFFEYMQPLFPDMKEGTIVAYLKGGKCIAVVFTPSADNADTITGKWASSTAITSTTWAYNTTDWDDEGILDGGILAGTSPAIKK